MLHGGLSTTALQVDSSGGTKLSGPGLIYAVAQLSGQLAAQSHEADQFERVERESRELDSLLFLSPETITNGDYDAPSELYSWGVVAYRLLSGADPYRERFPLELLRAKETSQPVPLSENFPNVSPELEALIMRAIAPARASRFQSMEEVIDALQPLLFSSEAAPEIEAVAEFRATRGVRRLGASLDRIRRGFLAIGWNMRARFLSNASPDTLLGLSDRADPRVSLFDTLARVWLTILFPLRVLWRGLIAQPHLGLVAVFASGVLALALQMISVPAPRPQPLALVEAPIPALPETPTPAPATPFAGFPVSEDRYQIEPENFESLPAPLAFSAQVDGASGIFLLDPITSVVRTLVENRGIVSSPVWSPSGEKLVFLGQEGGQRDIYILDLKSKDIQRVTNDSRNESAPAWSPEGSNLVYVVEVTRPDGEPAAVIELLDLRSGKVRPLGSKTGQQSFPSFSPDGESVFFSTDRFWPGTDICQIQIRDGREDCFLGGTSNYSRPRMSSDGKKLLYVLTELESQRIQLTEIGKANAQRSFTFAARVSDPALALDGSSVAFAAATEADRDRFQLFLFDETEAIVPIVRAPGVLRGPDWFPRDSQALSGP
jgi:hypothetical protein